MVSLNLEKDLELPGWAKLYNKVELPVVGSPWQLQGYMRGKRWQWEHGDIWDIGKSVVVSGPGTIPIDHDTVFCANLPSDVSMVC